MTAGRGARTVRAAVFAAVCVLLTALGHVVASGQHVPAWALGAGVAATGAAGWCLAGRERGLPMVVALVVAAQTALHSAFSFAQSTPAGSASADTHTMGSLHMSMDMGPIQTDSMGVGHMTTGHMSTGHMGPFPDGGGSSFGMVAVHLLAALVTGLWLAYGGKAAFRILRAVAGWLAAPLRLLLALPAAPDGRFRVRPGRPRSDRAPSLLLVHAITSRGPPVGTAVVRQLVTRGRPGAPRASAVPLAQVS